MAQDSFVGRIAFASARGYEAYADKVLRSERAPPAPQARVLFCSVRDGTLTTVEGYTTLMLPMVEIMKERKAAGTLGTTEIAAFECYPTSTPDTFLQGTMGASPTFLFSMSHGLGAPSGGWASAEQQRALQGAMSLGPSGMLAVSDLGSTPFLPGGVWFFFGCYSAGTPAVSAYHRWLLELSQAGQYAERADAVLAGLPRAGDRPFVAALPQAALESPNGPLAVIGHVDLAWASSYLDATTLSRGRPGRFIDVARALADGGRVGAACFELLRFWNGVDAHLAMLYGDDERPEDDARRALKARLWMLRNDLRGYVLLGDPAARLPISSAARAMADAMGMPSSMERSMDTWRPPALDAKQMEKAVLEALLGRELPSAIARRNGVEKAELQRWVTAYEEAGRAALAKLR
ncbi:Hypothetical protein A7982_00641 [Minicystis rosea]|nr:Hypothetical protein A7982_00641 [Minicystis rosea]